MTSGGNSTADVDPITQDIVLSRIRSVVGEMEILIGRAAMSPSLRDKKDYFMGLYDTRGRMIHALMGNSGLGMIDPVLERFSADNIEPGDVFCYNDPYLTRGTVTHLPDMVVVMPFFSGGSALQGFAVAYGHFADIGGREHGSGGMDSTEVFHEGIAYPPMKVGHGGQADDSFIEMLMRNSREPGLARGDWMALMAGCRLGVQRMESIVGHWDAPTVNAAVDDVIDQSARRVRAIINEQIPDGLYRGEADVDEANSDRPVVVRASLEKSGDRLVLDLSESDDQVATPLNYHASLHGVQLLFLMQLLVFEPDLKPNEGSGTNITELKTRTGSVVQPSFPAPLNVRSIVRTAVARCLFDIVAEANGGWMTAPMAPYELCKFAFRDGDCQSTFDETIGIGLGARPFGDGADVIYFSGQRNYPIEQVESLWPLRIENYAIAPDSGGAGTYRGGCGVQRDIRMLSDATVAPRLANTKSPSKGLAGGLAGEMARITIVHLDGTQEDLDGVRGPFPVRAGELVRLQSCGGGGWGPPKDRQPDLVERDVREGFISETAASDVYCTALVGGNDPGRDDAHQLRGSQ